MLLVCVIQGSPRAAWVTNGVTVCGEALDQTDPMAVSDAAGGAIIVWEDDRSSDWNIYAQRIDGAGMTLWTENGVAVVTASGTDDLRQVVNGNNGEAIILWKNGNYLYVQKINASGTKLWPTAGVRITTPNPPSTAVMVSDVAGGAIVAWIETRSGNDNIYAQRIGFDGTVQWATGGITVSAATGNESAPQIATDGAGGAMIAFVNNATATPNVYVQRVRASGAVWSASGTAMGANTYSRTNPAIAPDGSGGAIVVWENTAVTADIAAQRVNAAGSLVWGSGEVALCTADEDQTDPEIISDGSGGAVIVWRDIRDFMRKLYAQKVDGFGLPAWTQNGVPLCSQDQDAQFHRLLPAPSGRVLVVYANMSASSTIYGQMVNLAGLTQWGTNGKGLLRGELYEGKYGAIADGAGGLLLAIADDSPALESIDIVAQGINRLGHISAPEPRIIEVSDVPADQGAAVRIRVTGSDRDSIDLYEGKIAVYDVWQRIDDPTTLLELRRDGAGNVGTIGMPGVRAVTCKGRDFIEAALAGVFPRGLWEHVGGFDATQSDEYVYRATTLADSSSAGVPYAVYVISAHSSDPAVWFASNPDSGYSVDNIPPEAPGGLTAEQSFSPIGLALSWNVNGANDLSHYAVYRGTSEGFVPGPGNRVATPTAPEYFDSDWRWNGGYYYKISAIDVHDNQSGFALVRPDDVAGVETPKAPDADYLSQNYPNPFNPTTRIAFGLKEPATVSLRIYDAAGRLVRVLVEGDRPAGNFSELWDGRDASGRAVSSGIYFYRLTAGLFESMKKMVLLR
jgi:hypothetical protein